MPNKPKKKKKSPKKASLKKPAKKVSSAKLRSRLLKESAVIEVPVKPYGEEAVLGAAYLLTDRAFARISGSRSRSLNIELRPKGRVGASSLKNLVKAYEEELAAQKLRWEIARNNLPVREHIARLAVDHANGRLAPPEEAPAGIELSEEQQKEIDSLIAEVEAEIKELKKEKGLKDSKKLSASWEEKHGG